MNIIKKLFDSKGSTMVLLIMAIGIISLLGTSILSVTMMNYKIKKANTELKEAFYLSESGLDKAYAQVYALILESVEKSNVEAKDFINKFTIDKLEGYIGKPDYTKYLKWDEDKKIYVYKEDVIRDDAKLKFKSKYLELVEGDIENKLNLAEGPLAGGGEIKITYDDADLHFIGDTMTVPIHSEFISNKDIKKTTSVNLVIESAEYGESYTVETRNIPINPFLTKVLSARNLDVKTPSSFIGDVYLSENMYVNTHGVLISGGNLAVKGRDGYEDGIHLPTANASTEFNDVYSKNLILNGKDSRFETKSGSVYVKDDLEINNSGQKVIIDGCYYGFTDGSKPKDGEGPDQSSGININNSSDLQINITNDLYLLGTSYVNAVRNGKKYQTGESVSVKGNYRAYMQPVASMSNVVFNEYISDKDEDGGSLPFVDTFEDGSVFTAMDKAEYIVAYEDEYKKHPEGHGLNLPMNITFKERYTIGSTVKGGSLLSSNYITDYLQKFRDASNVYDLQIDRLGQEGLTRDITFGNQINIEADIDDRTDPANYVYVNKSGGTHELKGGNYKGIIIITGGNLEISGNVDFTGTIICDGNVTVINDGQPKKFTYSKNIVTKLVADKKLYEKVFGSGDSIDVIKVTAFVDEAEGSEENVDFSGLLKFKNWEIN